MANRFSVEAVFKAIDSFTAPITKMQNSVGKFSRSINNSFKSVNRSINSAAGSVYKMGKTVAAFSGVALAGVGAGIVAVVSEFSKIEDATAAFTPLLGSAEKARQLVDALNVAAAETPFRFNDLSDAAKQLLPTMGGDIEKTVATIKMLGDTAGGNAEKLSSITHGFTKAMLKGKVDLESLNMIGEAGVPIFTALADSMGKKVNPAFFKMISAGKVTTKQLTKAFEKMTSDGGMFFNGMDIASKTTSGLWSTFKDNISLTAAAIGGILAPTIKELIVGATEIAQKLRAWVEANKDFIRSKFIEYVDAARSAVSKLLEYFKNPERVTGMLSQLMTAMIMVGKAISFVVANGRTILKIVEWVLALIIIFKALAVTMAIVNFAMTANPIGLMVLGIAALIAAVSAAIIWWDELVAVFGNVPDWVKSIAANNPITLAIFAIVDAVKLLIKVWDAASSKIQSIGQFLGLTGGADVNVNQNSTSSVTPQVVTPQERNAQLLNETRSTSFAELLIKDSTGRAELNRRGEAPGIGFSMVPTGAF